MTGACALLVLSLALMPFTVRAEVISDPFEVSGWVPYWRTATGTADALAHADAFTEINPFGYTVDSEGHLYDAANLLGETWTNARAEAKAKHIRFIPTVMWSNGDAIHAVLTNPEQRALLVKQIVDEVWVNGWDGIDIDFEAKRAETKDAFSIFLRELYTAMGNRWVMCTVESRTPLDSRYSSPESIPDDIAYANDFDALNRWCDRVRIMAYDQQSIDLKLNASTPGPYSPVADPRWVEKVVEEAAKSISKRKLVLGIPTYGYEYDVTAYADGYTYDLLWSFNPQYALDMATTYNITPQRNAAGEKSFTYFPDTGAFALPRPASAWPGSLVASAAAAVAGTNNTHIPFRMMWWSDAQAINDKVELAQRLGLRGVAIFKIDGGEDPAMWDALMAAR